MRVRVTHALIALFAITPGAHELVEASAHAALVDAHSELPSVHAEEHEDAERGCSGPFHACVCHAPSLIFVRTVSSIRLERAVATVSLPRESFARGHAGYAASIFRPPIV